MKKLFKLLVAIVLGLGIGFFLYIFKIVKKDKEATNELIFPEDSE